jgi:hypothetical protein
MHACPMFIPETALVFRIPTSILVSGLRGAGRSKNFLSLRWSSSLTRLEEKLGKSQPVRRDQRQYGYR